MEYRNNTQQGQHEELNAYDFVGGYLAKEDLNGPTKVTIRDARREFVEGSPKPKLVLTFDELAKPLILNTTNIQTIAEIAGTGQTSAWLGLQVTVYVDSTVEFSGKKVGGIRVARPRTNGPAQAPGQYRRNVAPEVDYNI